MATAESGQWLTELLNLRYSNVFGPPDSSHIEEVTLIPAPYSYVFRILTQQSGEATNYYAKCTDNGPNKALARARLNTEYEILCRLKHALSADPELDVVTVVAQLEQEMILVTKEETGGTLETMINKSCRLLGSSNFDRALNSTHRAGRWLARFQEITATSSQHFEYEEFQDYCDLRIDKLLELSPQALPKQIKLRLARLAQMISKDPNSKNLNAGRHNDYAPHNIIENPGRICVLDFTMYNLGSTFYDVCNFLLKLERMCESRWLSNRKVKLLQQAFLQGYGQPDVALSPLYQLLCCRLHLVRMLSLCVMSENRFWKTADVKAMFEIEQEKFYRRFFALERLYLL